jgi:hypothetical protein
MCKNVYFVIQTDELAEDYARVVEAEGLVEVAC